MSINLKWLNDTIEEMREIYNFADEDTSIILAGCYPVPAFDVIIISAKDKETGVKISLEKQIPRSDCEERK